MPEMGESEMGRGGERERGRGREWGLGDVDSQYWIDCTAKEGG